MTTSPETEPRFGQLRNDVDALYKLAAATNTTVKKIADVQEQHGRILEKHDTRLDSHSEKLDSHSEKLDSHSEKLDRIEATLDVHSEKHDSHTEKLDTILGLLKNGRPAT